MSSLTCISCRVVFSDVESQRDHYKSDWHRYNLKRKVAEMPPVTQTEFKKRLAAQVLAENQSKSEKLQRLYCRVCRKDFGSKKSLENHVNSNKHRANEKAIVMEAERLAEEAYTQSLSLGTDEENSLAVKKKVYVAYLEEFGDIVQVRQAKSVEEGGVRSGEGKPGLAADSRLNNKEGTSALNNGNVEMKDDEQQSDDEDDDWETDDEDDTAFSMDTTPTSFSPAGSPLDCLFCSSRPPALSAQANLEHMASAHSFFVPHAPLLADLPGLLTYLHAKIMRGRLCLWCRKKSPKESTEVHRFKSGEAAKTHMRDMGHTMIRCDTPEQFVEYVDFYQEVQASEGEEGMRSDDEEESVIVDDGGYSLTLPSGAVIGHRSLARYYKQDFRGLWSMRPSDAEQSAKVGRKALGWTGCMSNQMDIVKVKDIRAMQRAKAKYWQKRGTQQNSLKEHNRSHIFWAEKY